jgi:hypothetical protein
MSVSAATTEQRRNIRLAVQPDHAKVTVMVDGAQHQGVMVNQSSEGFGLLILRGLRLDEGHHIRVVSEDAIHECLVCHRRPEDNYQHIGLRRVADVPFVERPKKKQAKRWFRYGAGGGLVSCIVLGSGILACILCVWNGPPEKTAEDRAAEQQARAASQIPDDMAPTDDQLENRERLRQQARDPGSSTRLSGAFFSRLTGRNETALSQTLAGHGLDWDGLVAELALSSSQQDSIIRLLTSGSSQSPATARMQLRSVLNRPQKTKVDLLAARL